MSIAVSVAVYVCIGILWGREGLWAYNQLQKQKIILNMSAEHLDDINMHLTAEYTALKQDKDIIAAYAKKLGYVSEGEHLVKITGIAMPAFTMYDPGTKVLPSEIVFIPEWAAKSIAVFVFFLYNLVYSVSVLVHRHAFTKVRSAQY